MSTDLNVYAYHVNTMMSAYRHFNIPSFQRGYSWKKNQISNFWNDISSHFGEDGYFLGLIILSKQGEMMNVIDGQQRLVTLLLLAKAVSSKARDLKMNDDADLIDSQILYSKGFSSDRRVPRISFVDTDDKNTFRSIIEDEVKYSSQLQKVPASKAMMASFKSLKAALNKYVGADKNRLKEVAEFITEKLYFAIFIHSDDESAFKVFEVVNTRGRPLTATDLLKNYILSEAKDEKVQKKHYDDWEFLSKEFSSSTSDRKFELYIKHCVNAKFGYIPKKDLYTVLSNQKGQDQFLLSATDLMKMLMERHALYRQFEDPTIGGPTKGRALELFKAFNSLGLESVRPILLSLCDMKDQRRSVEGMERLLKLVVRKMVAENIGVGKVENQFCLAAKTVSETGNWDCFNVILASFDIDQDTFIKRLRTRVISAKTLEFVRRSALQETTTPDSRGFLHWICPPNSPWGGFRDDEEGANLVRTLGNTMLANVKPKLKFPPGSWSDFLDTLMIHADRYETVVDMRDSAAWDPVAVERFGREVADAAARIWYPDE